jgi:hypothetical protein
MGEKIGCALVIVVVCGFGVTTATAAAAATALACGFLGGEDHRTRSFIKRGMRGVIRFCFFAKIPKKVKGIEAIAMTIRPMNPHGVVADGFPPQGLDDIKSSELLRRKSRLAFLTIGAGTFAAQMGEGVFADLPVIPSDAEEVSIKIDGCWIG